MVRFATRDVVIGVDAHGMLESISAKGTGRECLVVGLQSPILQVSVGDIQHAPGRAEWDGQRGELTLYYDGIGVKAVLAVQAKPTHVVFELVGVDPSTRVDLVRWGPYNISIGNIVGEVVGVVRDANFAFGLQSLNPKTIGGSTSDEDDALVGGREIDDPGTYPGLPNELSKASLFRGSTAWPAPFGSIIQAFCRDRSTDRIISNWGHEKYIAPAIADGGVIGSKIALFGCPIHDALNTIGEIEVEEGLPHPTIDGVWAKKSPLATSSYLIIDFGEMTIDHALDLAKRAGLQHIYHSSPFSTWGHFSLRLDLFPNGWEGFKVCVDKAREVGINIGFHTLSNFTSPNDAYVQPKPDPRLAKIGTNHLATDIDSVVEEIPVTSPDFFQKETALNTVIIGDELIHYTSVSESAPWVLHGCERGEWGTAASPHERGDPVGKLMDHGYKVFLADADLAGEEARTIAAFCNKTGAMRVSMDGLEGNWAAGHGQYGRIRFMHAWYEALKPSLKGRVLNDASNPAHFNWHINTYFNWGEPWYDGFRESQALYRFKNQVFYERNFIPKMLGWFALRHDTTVEDVEWLLARAAGYDAGFSLATSIASTARQDAAPSSVASPMVTALVGILETIKQWETARMAGAFPEAIKAMLRDVSQEFHLEPVGMNKWRLYQVISGKSVDPVEIVGNRNEHP